MITQRKTLRTPGPLWLHERSPRLPYRRPTRDLRADVLIVGAGITGAMTAQALSEAGFDVVVVDRRAPGQGSTAASTALVQYEIDTPLLELQRKIGARNAARAWRRARLAVDSLRATFRRLGIEAQSRDALYLAGNRLDATALGQEAQLRRAAGLDTVYLTAGDVQARFGIARRAALMSFDNLAINPRRAAAELLRRAHADGARLYAPANVEDIGTERAGMVARIAHGPAIHTRWIVLATGYEFPKMAPMRGHRITTTWAFATRPQPRKLWPEQCLVWEASTPYLYLRTTPDGRVLCGGEDASQEEHPDNDTLMARKLARLQAKLGRLLPAIDTRAEFSWAASFGETSTGLPTIGPVPRHPNCWAALGYGGNGIVYARIAAEIIRAGLTGQRDMDADLYAFG
jgi:glycine/D-amino acid oxidase-like deaminating enzyme